jgi:hypothetical protein
VLQRAASPNFLDARDGFTLRNTECPSFFSFKSRSSPNTWTSKRSQKEISKVYKMQNFIPANSSSCHLSYTKSSGESGATPTRDSSSSPSCAATTRRPNVQQDKLRLILTVGLITSRARRYNRDRYRGVRTILR